MKTEKKLGIWMDHSNAHLIEFAGNDEDKDISSTFTHEVKEQSLGKSEHLMHNKEQHTQAEFYKKIGQSILNYDEVLLFGPTDAKSELLNLLKADTHFSKIKIDIRQADKMTDHQQHALVKEHFSSH